MTRHAPARYLLGVLMAVVLTACGGSGSDGGEPAADAGAAGAPGGDRDAGDDATAEGNPGAPGDVAVFEEAGVPFSVLRADAETKCADGVCTLAEPQVASGDPEAVGGVDNCLIEEQSDIVYDPPASGGFFQEGATVTAWVNCDAGDDGSDDSGDDTGDDTTDDQPEG